jgi:DnaK suppressor protein
MHLHSEEPVSALDETTREELRLALEHERERMWLQLRALSRRADPADRGEPGDAADLTERFTTTPEVENSLHAQYEERLFAIEAAIARMEAGTYGISLATGEPIPVERLRAVPWAVA